MARSKVGARDSYGLSVTRANKEADGFGHVGVAGHWHLIHQDKDGNVLSDQKFHNRVPNSGLDFLVAALDGDQTLVYNYIAVGSTSPGTTVGTTTMLSEITQNGLVRVIATAGGGSIGDGTATKYYYHQFSCGGTETVREVGILAGATAGAPLFCRGSVADGDFSEVPLTSSDVLTVQVTITFSSTV